MPNGESKNWVRFQITLEKFYTLFGRWPTRIYLYSFFINELQKKLSQNDFQRLQSMIHIIADDDNPFLAFDNEGNKFDYARGIHTLEGAQSRRWKSIKALEWLKIKEPDYYD